MYTKMFQCLLDSSIWCESSDWRIVWMTMLLMADQDGMVLASAPGIANRARVPLDVTLAALKAFQEPDEHSRTLDHEGRRVERVDGGFLILNYIKYRETRDASMAKAQTRERVRRFREKRSATLCNAGNANHNPVTPGNGGNASAAPGNAITEAEAEAEAGKNLTQEKTPCARAARSHPAPPGDPKVKQVGDEICKAYQEAHNGLPFREQGQMRRDLKNLLRNKDPSEILSHYRDYLRANGFYQDHAWGKFTRWWAEHETTRQCIPMGGGYE